MRQEHMASCYTRRRVFLNHKKHVFLWHKKTSLLMPKEEMSFCATRSRHWIINISFVFRYVGGLIWEHAKIEAYHLYSLCFQAPHMNSLLSPCFQTPHDSDDLRALGEGAAEETQPEASAQRLPGAAQVRQLAGREQAIGIEKCFDAPRLRICRWISRPLTNQIKTWSLNSQATNHSVNTSSVMCPPTSNKTKWIGRSHFIHP